MYVWPVAPPMGLPLRYHWLPVALLDVSVTLSPAQKVVGPPGVTAGTGGIGLTRTAGRRGCRAATTTRLTTACEVSAGVGREVLVGCTARRMQPLDSSI